ncbi:hypothetical protein [Dasania marina]|uniref:hypothetical protein n=1 Tax=Dasania marina TaxID=471499 RepID=UPI0030DCA176
MVVKVWNSDEAINAWSSDEHAQTVIDMGIDTHQEPIIYMRSDCHSCEALQLGQLRGAVTVL